VTHHAGDLGVAQLLCGSRALLGIGCVVFSLHFELDLLAADGRALALRSSMAMRTPFSLSLP
jgi:hypothetical protein